MRDYSQVNKKHPRTERRTRLAHNLLRPPSAEARAELGGGGGGWEVAAGRCEYRYPGNPGRRLSLFLIALTGAVRSALSASQALERRSSSKTAGSGPEIESRQSRGLLETGGCSWKSSWEHPTRKNENCFRAYRALISLANAPAVTAKRRDSASPFWECREPTWFSYLRIMNNIYAATKRAFDSPLIPDISFQWMNVSDSLRASSKGRDSNVKVRSVNIVWDTVGWGDFDWKQEDVYIWLEKEVREYLFGF